jgi:hypothetical protein
VIGWKSLPQFLNEINILQGNGHLRDESPKQIMSSNAINLALSVETGTPHEIRRVSTLTRILFSDLRKIPNVLLVVFDSYEQATTKLADWISGPFLSHIAYASNVRVLLAGQVIPNPDNIEWGGFCTTFELSGVANSINWLPIVHAMGRFIPVDDPESWLAGVCHALRGQPSAIMKIIESLPRMESVP